MGGFAGMTMVAAFRHLLAVGAALRRDWKIAAKPLLQFQ